MNWAAAGAVAQGAAGPLTAGVSGMMNINQAEVNRKWQAGMASTAYQRAVADMRAAGLNPMLAYSQGGADTPGGSKAEIPDFGPTVNSAIASVREYKLLKQRVENETSAVSAEVALKGSQKATQDALTAKIAKEAGLVEQQTLTSAEQATLYKADAAIRRAELAGAEAKAKVWRALQPVIGDVIKAIGKLGTQSGQLEPDVIWNQVKKDISAQGRVELEHIIKNSPYGQLREVFRFLAKQLDASRNSAVDPALLDRSSIKR